MTQVTRFLRSMGGWPVLLKIGLGLLVVLALVALLAPWISPYNPGALSGEPLEPPSLHHLLGTDDIGRDVLAQIIWGARTSLLTAVAAAALAVSVGTLTGVTVALIGGRVDFLAMRAVDIMLSLPIVPLLLVVVALAGPGRSTVILAIGLVAWPRLTRVLRSQTLTIRQRGYIHAARRFGGGVPYILRRHVIPAVAPLIVASFVATAGIAVGLDSGLAFLGLADPTQVSWGRLLDTNRLQGEGLYASAAWVWMVLPAGVAVTLAVLGFAFVGVALEPRTNPAWSRGS